MQRQEQTHFANHRENAIFYDEMKAFFTDSDVIQPDGLCSSRRRTQHKALDELDVNHSV